MLSEEDKVLKIWMAKSEAFNQWRRENDLKFLFQYIIEHSQSFVRWLDMYSLCLEDILAITPSRDVFFGENSRRFIDYADEQKNKHICLTSLEANFSEGTKIIRDFEVKPYFMWKNLHEPKETFLINSKGNHYKDISLRNSGSFSERKIGKNSLEVNEVVLLFGEVKILDIGDVSLASDFGLFNKNLDFMCLNNITLYDSSNMFYSGFDVCCSSVKNLHLKNTTAQFFKFTKCQCSRLKIENSIVLDLRIEESFMDDMLYGIYIDRSKVDRFVIKHVDIKNINIYDSELSNFQYIPEKLKGKMKFISKRYHVIYNNVKRLRLSFESVGNSYEASQFYYWEKNLERKCFRHNLKSIAPKSKYGGTYFNIIKNLFKKQYNLKNSIRYFKWKTEYYYKFLTIKDYRNKLISLVANNFRLYFEWLLWGYGEKPSRIVFNSLFVIIIYSIFYFYSDNVNMSRQIINSIYYSIITFTTLGYGDILPHTTALKVLSASEALLGALAMGLIIAGFTKKSRS